jgi:hypothetical protein
MIDSGTASAKTPQDDIDSVEELAQRPRLPGMLKAYAEVVEPAFRKTDQAEFAPP